MANFRQNNRKKEDQLESEIADSTLDGPRTHRYVGCECAARFRHQEAPLGVLVGDLLPALGQQLRLHPLGADVLGERHTPRQYHLSATQKYSSGVS